MNATKLDTRLGRLLRRAGFAIDCTRIDGHPLTLDDRNRVRALLVAFGVDADEQARKVVSINSKRADGESTG
jgi:hypothetical protein